MIDYVAIHVLDTYANLGKQEYVYTRYSNTTRQLIWVSKHSVKKKGGKTSKRGREHDVLKEKSLVPCCKEVARVTRDSMGEEG